MADVLRQEIKAENVHVTTVFPGRVDTPMISHLDVPWISPKIPVEKVARATIIGMLRKKPEVIVPRVYYLFLPINALFPRLMDRFYRWMKLEGSPKKKPSGTE
jgi:short-subunit dehydrogenase